ncbi:hypothetical protein ACWC09_24895 [Streptomyces sp. NPDC001617]
MTPWAWVPGSPGEAEGPDAVPGGVVGLEELLAGIPQVGVTEPG